MAERSRDRSSSTESQPKFPECSHFRRRNDNHRRCQQCRLNDGLPQDSSCLVCQDWLPEAWTAQAKAIAQRTRRKAAATAKAVRKETEMLDDSVELHAPGDAFPTKRTKSSDSSKAKRSKTATSSSQPKSVASSVTAVERPSSHGSDHRRSRTPERKRRHGEERCHESLRHQSSRHEGPSSDRRESERARPSSSAGSSSRRRAESGSVSKASDTRPSRSSSRHHQHHSSGDRRSLSSSSSGGVGHPSVELFLSPSSASFFGRSSIPVFIFIRGVSRPQVSAQSLRETTRELRQDGWDVCRQTGCQAISCEAQGPWEMHYHGGCLAGSTDSDWIDPSSSSPGPGSSSPGHGSGRLSRCGPGRKRWLGHEWRHGSTQRHGHKQRPDHRSRLGHRRVGWSSTSSSTGSERIGRAGESGSYASGWTRQFHPDGDQHSSTLPFHSEDHQWVNIGGFYVFNAAWNRLVFQTSPSGRLSSHLYLFLNMTPTTRDQPRRLDLQQEPSLQRGSSIRLKSSVSSLVRRAKEADRQARTPVRPPRTPVRRSRNHSESRDSRSRSPLSRSSSVESTAPDGSPLNFNAALDMDSKRALSEDEDAEGDGKKISAAQYEIFRQAVTSSKGTYKINPAKTKRAARASLLDLGDTEVPDRVSWLDQPSLQDTMASTARIAQGLKEDKEVVLHGETDLPQGALSSQGPSRCSLRP